ncbi:hypothetical protein KPL78_19125 [Roseomonas sp. HJA6]|uniref:SWIM-type domain-containing protein n=1 Tax=Roseomonas alba TaxID=2846776 RepID=A0ABS7ACF7_9PROT|nr:hypothetical protein [Neoroseomonas alba]MBW6399981.1 hypothetical protein [Neoroseomonas alba]
MEFTFLVSGSQPEPYRVVFTVDGADATALCTCPAGAFDRACKHRIGLLQGDISRLASANPDDLAALATAMEGTDILEAMRFLDEAEDRLEAAKTAVAEAKRRLARAMGRDAD